MAIYYRLSRMTDDFTPPRPGTWTPRTAAVSLAGMQKNLAQANSDEYSGANSSEVLAEGDDK